MANETTLEITENITKVEVTEDVTSINITPNITTVELKGISISNAGSASAMTYEGQNNDLGEGSTVEEALDHINTKGVSINKTNIMEYGSKINFTAPGEGQVVYPAMNLANNDIISVNKITFSDPGPNEGLQWQNIRIYESPDDLTTNVPSGAGNFQVVYKQGDDSYARRFTVKDTGVDVVGITTSTSFSGPLTGNVTGDVTGNVTGNVTGGTITATSFSGPLTGNVTGQVTDISNHITDDLTEGDNLYYTDARVNTKLGAGVDNIVTTGYLRGPSTFTIDPAGHGDISGKVVIAGDLQVDGTTTTVNSTTLDVKDKTLTLAKGTTDASAAHGAGLYIEGADVSFGYVQATDSMALNKDLRIFGNLRLMEGLETFQGNTGTAGQILVSTGDGIDWETNSLSLNVTGDIGNTETITIPTEALAVEGTDPITTTMSTNKVSISLNDSSVSAGTYGASETIPRITVNSKGIITSVEEISGEVGPTGPVGGTGPQGLRGANGANTLQFNFETNTSMAGNLSAGKVQLNKLDYELGMALKISSTDDSGTNVKDFIRFLTSSTNPDIKGHITLTNQQDPDRFLLLEITNSQYETDNDNETLVSVNRVAGLTGGNSLQDGIVGTTTDPTILVSFLRAADFGQFDSIQDLPDVSSSIPPADGSILSYSSAGGEYRPDLVENFAKLEKTYINVEAGAGVFKGNPYGLVALNPTTERPIVGLTDADNEQLCLGIAYENISNGQAGKLLTRGILKGVDTSYTRIPGTGNFVYISSAVGGLTRTPPVLRTTTTQQVGYILKTSLAGQTDGILYVDIGSKAIGVANLDPGEFAFGGDNGEQKFAYRDRALPITAAFGVAGNRTYRNVLTAVDTSGNNVHQFNQTTIEKLNLGDKNNSELTELNIYPGSTGKCQLHYGSQTNPNNFGLEESQRLHTTSNGIHVGNNLQDGSYTAGDMHVNNDTGYGIVTGQSITNAGHNSFLVGQQHNISADSANFMGVGYDIDTTGAVHQSLGVGTHIDFVGSNNESAPHWGMLGVGRHVKVEEEFAVALGYGSSADQIKSTGLASFAQGYKSRALANYTFAVGGAQNRDGIPVRPEASVLGAMCMGPNTVSGQHSIGIGKFNTVEGDYGAASIGTYNTAKGDKSITLGEGNLTQDATGSLSQVAIGTSHELYGDSCVAIGKSCFTPTAIGNVAAGLGVKASQRNIAGYPAQGDGQVVVGAYNDNLKEWASDDYTNDIVAPLHFSVGTGSADGSRYTSMAIGPRSPSANPGVTSSTGEAGFCGIVMQALADSASYTDAEASHANSHVPIGGLYRTGNIVKIRLA